MVKNLNKKQDRFYDESYLIRDYYLNPGSYTYNSMYLERPFYTDYFKDNVDYITWPNEKHRIVNKPNVDDVTSDKLFGPMFKL